MCEESRRGCSPGHQHACLATDAPHAFCGVRSRSRANTRRACVRFSRFSRQAKDKGKPDVYVAYKQAKVDFTANMIKTAMLVQNLQKAGLM